MSNKAKVFELRKRLDSLATDIFVGRAPTNDIVLADPSVTKSHFRFISIPETKHYQLADMFSTNGTYLNGKKIDPFEKHRVEDHDEISFGTEYQLVYYPPRAFYEMLISLKDNESKDREQKQTAEDLAPLPDSIDKEVVDMADSVLPEESIKEDMSNSDEDEAAELEPELFFEEEDLQLDLETTEDSANSATEIQPKEEDAKTEMDTSVDDKDEDEKMPVETEKLNTDTEEAETTGEENASASILSDKISAIVDRIVEEKISAIAQQPSKNLSGDRELKSGVEEQEEVGGQKSEGSLLNDELAALMKSRIQKMVTRTLEERMPAMIERSMLDAIKKILLSM